MRILRRTQRARIVTPEVGQLQSLKAMGVKWTSEGAFGFGPNALVNLKSRSYKPELRQFWHRSVELSDLESVDWLPVVDAFRTLAAPPSFSNSKEEP